MTPADILDLTCRGFGVTLDAMRARFPGTYVRKARASAIASLKQLGLSSSEVGALLSMDPSTVRYHLTKRPARHPLHPPPAQPSHETAPAQGSSSAGDGGGSL